MEVRLIVIRTPDPGKLVAFYSLLGLFFEEHRHGKGPLHHAASLGRAVLEIYPLAKGQTAADPFLRIGFGISSFDERIAILKQKGVTFPAEPASSAFGYFAVVLDPDGRKVELYPTEEADTIAV